MIEDINKQRQPFSQDAIYFIQPDLNSLKHIKSDMETGVYTGAYVFFSHKVPQELVSWIRSQPPMVAKLKGLKEVRAVFRGLC